MDGNVLEMDGNVLEMICPNLLCIGIEGGVGLWALFFPHNSGVFVTLQPDVPCLGHRVDIPACRGRGLTSPEVLLACIRAHLSSAPLLGPAQSMPTEEFP